MKENDLEFLMMIGVSFLMAFVIFYSYTPIQ
jgi:hypothetical protein